MGELSFVDNDSVHRKQIYVGPDEWCVNFMEPNQAVYPVSVATSSTETLFT